MSPFYLSSIQAKLKHIPMYAQCATTGTMSQCTHLPFTDGSLSVLDGILQRLCNIFVSLQNGQVRRQSPGASCYAFHGKASFLGEIERSSRLGHETHKHKIKFLE
jgi:hypothetical protein